MKSKSTAPPKTEPTERIQDTLHGPAHAPNAPRQDVNLPREKSEQSEVAGRHKNTGQKDHKGAR